MKSFNKDKELVKSNKSVFLIISFSIALLITVALYNSYASFSDIDEDVDVSSTAVGVFGHVLMARDSSSDEGTLWENSENITTVEFLKESRNVSIPASAIKVYNASPNGNVFAWIVDDGSGNSTYKLYIQAFEALKLNPDSSRLFAGMKKLTSINGLENVDTTSVESMASMFKDCNALTEIDLSNFNTESVINMSYMFSWCNSLQSLDLSTFRTSSLENMSYMFEGLTLKSLDLSMFDTSNVTNMMALFSMSSSLLELDISSFDTTNVTNMSTMFQNCRSLTDLDLSHFDTSKVTTMSYMFNNCTGLKYVNLSSFDTSKVTNMIYMFVWCNQLRSLDVSHFDTSSLTEMGYMFFEVQVGDLDVSTWDFSKIINFASAFAYVRNAKFTLNVTSNNIRWVADVFKDCAINSTNGAEVIVNYTAQNESKIDEMLATKSENSNVKKGSLITQ